MVLDKKHESPNFHQVKFELFYFSFFLSHEGNDRKRVDKSIKTIVTHIKLKVSFENFFLEQLLRMKSTPSTDRCYSCEA